MKQCKDCGQDKDILRFATYKDRSGNNRRRGVCWDCRGQYATDHFEEQKRYRKQYNKRTASKRNGDAAERRAKARKYVDAIKASTPCKDCGRSWAPVAMDFDHIGPKIKGIANMVSQGYKIELIQIEIQKCEIVCACCHRIRTANRNDNVSVR